MRIPLRANVFCVQGMIYLMTYHLLANGIIAFDFLCAEMDDCFETYELFRETMFVKPGFK